MKDLLGKELQIGDQILYVNYHGSSLRFTIGRIDEIAAPRVRVTRISVCYPARRVPCSNKQVWLESTHKAIRIPIE